MSVAGDAVQCCEELACIEFEAVGAGEGGGRWTHRVIGTAAHSGGPQLRGFVDMACGQCELRVLA
jgi:hypothetical protein